MSVDMNVAGSITGSVGHGGTSIVNNTFRVLIQRNSVVVREGWRTDVCRKAFIMSDRSKPPHCAARVAFSEVQTREYSIVYYV